MRFLSPWREVHGRSLQALVDEVPFSLARPIRHALVHLVMKRECSRDQQIQHGADAEQVRLDGGYAPKRLGRVEMQRAENLVVVAARAPATVPRWVRVVEIDQ